MDVEEIKRKRERERASRVALLSIPGFTEGASLAELSN